MRKYANRLSHVLNVSAVLILILFGAVRPMRAEASCNAAPDPFSRKFADPNNPQPVPPPLPQFEPPPADLRYRGLFGRANRGVLLPGVTDSVIVGPDLACGERVLQPNAAAGHASAEDVVGIMIFDREAPTREVAVYAAPEVQRRIADRFSNNAATNFHAVPIPYPIWQSDKLEVAYERDAKDRETYRVRLHYPDRNASGIQDAAASSPLAGRSLVALVGAGETGVDNIVPLLGTLLAGGCKAIEETFATRHDGYVCIDDFYDEFAEAAGALPDRINADAVNARCRNISAKPLASACTLLALNSPTMDFGDQCHPTKGSSPGQNAPACGKKPGKYSFDVDPCGNVHIPISWANVLPPQGTFVGKRSVSGRSGVAREDPPNGDLQMLLPGREFVGSTHPSDVNGKAPEWRLPDVDVIPPGDDKFVGLIGSVDQPKSIIHIRPRLKVGYLCKFRDPLPPNLARWTEGCLGVTQTANGGVEECAFDGLGGISCDPNAPARYYACVGGTFDGMPCTRPNHCPIGRCSGTPTCQPSGEVWRQGKTHTGAWKNTDCTVDSQCKGTKDAATGQIDTPQCGYALFEFRGRADANGVVTLKSGLNGFGNNPFSTPTNKQRGICFNDYADDCYDGSLIDCFLKGGCTGYVLEAGDWK